MTPRARRWLRWYPPLMLAIAVLWALQLGGRAGLDFDLSRKPIVWGCAAVLVPQIALLGWLRQKSRDRSDA